MQAYPYRFIGDSVRCKLAEVLSPLLDAWAKAWFVSPPPYSISIEDGLPADAEWQVSASGDELWIACGLKERAQRDFMQLLFGPSSGNASSAILAEVLAACTADLRQRLMQQAHAIGKSNEEVSLAGLRTGAGSGMLHVALTGSLPIERLALGGAVVEALVGDVLPANALSTVLTPRSALLSKGRAKVRLGLGTVELPLSELAGIAVGDVLTLDTSYLAPLKLAMEDGQELCKVNLGRSGQQKAVQIISK